MKKLGIVLLLLGMGILPVFWGAGFLAFLKSPEVPAIVKLAVVSAASGALLLLISSMRENWGEKDKYREVKQ
ncbi:MAG: hypothetical protein COV48_02725 [Elusimicrobia bacterium CG11_big_fil_rev_8_21_14_0_20_64_6]|nr:MAG: hypothetical protein COV48_02725 [Elusimicrobia bacterium CG11_big_fil_rev_8_21_14_0_20_64_6]